MNRSRGKTKQSPANKRSPTILGIQKQDVSQQDIVQKISEMNQYSRYLDILKSYEILIKFITVDNLPTLIFMLKSCEQIENIEKKSQDSIYSEILQNQQKVINDLIEAAQQTLLFFEKTKQPFKATMIWRFHINVIQHEKVLENEKFVINFQYEPLENNLFSCPKCRKNLIYRKKFQMRSADEGFTYVYCCAVCKFEWFHHT